MNKVVKDISIVLGILLLLSTGCGIYPSQDDKQSKAEKLTILDSKLVPVNFGHITIQGQAQNISNRQLRYAEIRAKFYDNNGKVVESSRTNTLYLGSNELWGFEIHCIGDTPPITKYEISLGAVY
jgi:hypothetical protein